MKVLLVKLSSMGDVIHALPALTDAGKVLSDVRFDWVVEKGFAEIPAWHGLVDRIIPISLRQWRREPIQAIKSGKFRSIWQQVRDDHYDVIIDAQGLVKSAVLSCFARGSRCGMDWHSAREPLASLFYRERYHVPRGQHAITRIRQLFASSLDYSVPKGVPDYGLDRNQFAGNARVDATDSNYIVFLHGTSRTNKCWDEAHWKILSQLVRDDGYGVKLPWGSSDERERAERIAWNHEGVEVLPKLGLTDIAVILSGAKGVVAVDTGLGHLAAALSVPCVSLYGPTDPALIGAWGESQSYLPLSSDPQSVWDAVR